MTSAFAIETYVANYDFTAYVELLMAYSPVAPIRLPGSDPFNVALNVESRAAQVASGILLQYLTLCCPEVDRAMVQPLPDEAAAAQFVADFSTSASSDVLTAIDSFTFVPLDVIDPDAYEVYTSDRNKVNMARRVAVLGADATTDVAVRFATSFGDVYGLFSVVRYGDRWWINELGGTFAILLDASVVDGGLVPVD
jgi:hypothetical protein